MEADRWDQLAVLFEQAQALAPGERVAFLDEACGGDADLRAQLDALLHTDGEARAYFESLAGDVFAPSGAEAAVSEAPPPRQVAHYEVLEKLGGGGMGVVYKARDTRLDRYVALKFLPPAFSANEEAKQRFVAEAKAASALNHFNICTIHEIGEAGDGQLFIAMACYQGETLKRKIQQGPLPVEEALDYAVQIARGLTKAHGQGIVHRDVKPANIMVTDDGVVKLLDFGLAKVADVQLTKTGTTMGTVAYMSPEQARGHKVDQRTDVWSLGVVLYEMLTGQRPFKGDYDQAIVYAILHEEPTPLTQVKADLPPDLSHVVAMCLEKERDLRYATMADVLADLQVFAQHSASDLSVTRAGARRRAATRRRRVWAGAAAGLLVLMTLALLMPASRQALLAAVGMASPPALTYVAVLPFTSNTPDAQALADGLMHSLTGLIARLETTEDSLLVVPAGDILDQKITTAQQAKKIFGVNKVLRGRLEHLGAQTQVVLELEDTAPPRIVGSATLPGLRDAAFQEKSLEALAALLDVRVARQVRQATRINNTTTPGARSFYLEGTGYLQRYDKTGNIDNAIALFTRAIEEDSLYAPALAGLCEAYLEKYRKTNVVALADQARRQCDRAAALADQQASVLVPLGRAYLSTGNDKKAEAVLLQAESLEPDNAYVYRWLGRVYLNQGAFDQAEKAFRRAIDLKPELWIYYNELAELFYLRGRYQEASQYYEVVMRLAPDNYLGYNGLAFTLFRLNRVAEASELFQQSIRLQPNPRAYQNLGRLRFRDQHYAEAVALLEKARDLNEENWTVWHYLGHAYYWAGDKEEALAAWQRLIEQAEQQLDVNARNSDALLLLADAYIMLGNHERGLGYLHRLLAMPHEDIQYKFYIGRMYELLGERDLALDYITQALEAQFDPFTPDRDPWLEALRKEPRYQALRNRFLETDEKTTS